MLALLYTQEEFAALRAVPERARKADLVGIWFDGQVKLIRVGRQSEMAVTVSWQRWREMMEKEEAHGP